MKFSQAPSVLVLLPILVQSFLAPLSLAKVSSAEPTTSSRNAGPDAKNKAEITPSGDVKKDQIVKAGDDERRINPWTGGPLRTSPIRRMMDVMNNFERMMFGPDISPFTTMSPFLDEADSDSGELSNALSSFMTAPAMGQLDISESDKEWKVNVDLPGIKKEDINVEINRGILTISAERKEQKQTKGESFTRQERSYGSVQRALRLPINVNPDSSHIKAVYDHGVLHLTLEKTDDHKPETKRIEIH